MVDSIYTEWSIFMDPISLGTYRKEKWFLSYQEGVIKYIEISFGVLVSRWYILYISVILLQKPCFS